MSDGVKLSAADWALIGQMRPWRRSKHDGTLLPLCGRKKRAGGLCKTPVTEIGSPCFHHRGAAQ